MNSSTTPTPDWAAVDWGTSRLRIWLMGPDGQILHTVASAEGMKTLQAAQFESVLLTHLTQWLSDDRCMPVICCGMVGARQGWHDAGYLSVPSPPLTTGTMTAVKTKNPRIQVFILPGVSQQKPADVMRGEETQLAGLLQRNAAFDGCVCLPGTHSKWVRIESGCIQHFNTCMTGELFALLSTESVLRHSMNTDHWSDHGFEQGVRKALNNPERLLAHLFSLRAENLLHGESAELSRSRLSGLLLGAELAAMREYWQIGQVMLIGESRLSTLYAMALESVAVRCHSIDGDESTVSGLTTAYNQLEQSRL